MTDPADVKDQLCATLRAALDEPDPAERRKKLRRFVASVMESLNATEVRCVSCGFRALPEDLDADGQCKDCALVYSEVEDGKGEK